MEIRTDRPAGKQEFNEHVCILMVQLGGKYSKPRCARRAKPIVFTSALAGAHLKCGTIALFESCRAKLRLIGTEPILTFHNRDNNAK